MFQKTITDKTLCKTCLKAPKHKGRTQCLKCIAKKEKTAVKAKEKRIKAVDKKRFSRTSLIKEADRVWSLFIRERDKGKPCITCRDPWTETAQAWHFLSRRYLNTRWLATNWNGQCVKCNNWWCGEQLLYAQALEERTPWLSLQIQRLAMSNTKTTDEEILHYIRLYYYELSQMWWTNEMIGIKQYYLK